MPTHFYRRIQFANERQRGRGTYRATQLGDEVLVTAVGNTPTPNYKVWLQFGPERIYPPFVDLWWMRPPGLQLQVLTPFSVHTTLHVGDQQLERIRVRDADGIHEIEVEQLSPPSEPPQAESHQTVANWFRLTMGETPISYATTSFIGEPVMSIGDRHFYGDDLTIEQTALGQQVTVVTEAIPDLKTVTLTLVVPQVLLRNSRPAEVELPAITATHSTTIAGPPPGQSTHYELCSLSGVAEFLIA